MDLIERYKEEIGKDLVINELNVKEVQLRLPSRRHYWVGRLIDCKISHNNLCKKKKNLKKTLVRKIISESPVKITQQSAEIAAETAEEMVLLTESIKEYEFCIEYLEKVEKIMSNMGYDISNIVKIMAMEQL